MKYLVIVMMLCHPGTDSCTVRRVPTGLPYEQKSCLVEGKRLTLAAHLQEGLVTRGGGCEEAWGI